MIVDLTQTAWPSVPERPSVLIPVGSIEQHGLHLPFNPDGLVAVAVARGLAVAASEPIVVAPLMPYGSSGEHQAFPGTISIGAGALRMVVIELVRSIANWSGRIMFVNGHGGNGLVLSSAIRRLRDEGHNVGWFACRIQGADAHAGVTETSIMLHLEPGVVDLAHAVPGLADPIEAILPQLRMAGVGPLSPNGVLGDPTAASAERGAMMMDELVGAALAAFARWAPDEDGRID